MEAFRSEENDNIKFEVYAHEENGVMSIISGSDSQESINAVALGHEAFITYAGDKIGNATIDELMHELDNAKSLFRFIYVLHQPGLVNEEMEGSNYPSWQEFYDKYMQDGKIKYYETELPKPAAKGKSARQEESLHNIRVKAAAIARELRNKALPEVYPPMLDYSRVISAGQSNYRRALEFYFPRNIDDKIRESISCENPAALTIVSGTSLAGKTRAVTEALKTLPESTHIHILQFDEHASDNLARINPEYQFRKEFHNILFIDDLHSLLETDSNAPHLIMALCRFAASNPGRLQIIATSILCADDILSALRPLCTGDSWLQKCVTIDIGPMQRQEILQMVRQLRRKGKIDIPTLPSFRMSNVPLGAIFVDLGRMRNYYGEALRRDYMLCFVFDAIKTLWLWKVKSRSDTGTLLEFINGAYADELEEPLSRRELIGLIRLIPEFAMLTGGLKPKMVIEEILVNEVFRFEASGNIDNAIKRIISYISRNEMPLKAFTKLVDRLERSGQASIADNVVAAVRNLYPDDRLPNVTETEPSMGECPLDWVDTWRGAAARSLIRRNDASALRAMVPADPKAAGRSYHSLLATVISEERGHSAEMSATLNGMLGTDGMPAAELLDTPVVSLVSEFLYALPFDKSLQCFARVDFRRMTLNSTPAGSEDEFVSQKIYGHLSAALKAILSRTESPEQVEKVMAELYAHNERLSRRIFSCDAEAWFRVARGSAWQAVGQNIPEANVPLFFNRLLTIDIPPAHPLKAELTTAKAAILNGLTGHMDEHDARDAWMRMGPLRDNFTLTAILKRLPDFATAKGFVDEYLESESGRDAKVNIYVLNALLNTCKTASDTEECRKLFVKNGLLAPDTALGDISDEYTQGILLKSDSVSFDEKLRILRTHKEESKVRNIHTTGKIIQHAPDYESARTIIYGETDVVNENEQMALQSSALVLSWLMKKVDSEHSATDARNILDDVRRRELNGESPTLMYCHPDANLLSETVKNRFLCPTVSDAVDFLKSVKSDFPELPENLIPMCNIEERMLEDEYPALSDKTIAFANRLLLENPDAPIEIRRRLVKNRFYGRPSIPRNAPFPDFSGLYPMFNESGTMELRSSDSLSFAMDMLRHGIMHPFMMTDIVRHVIDKSQDAEEKLRYITAQAKKWKIYVDHKAYISLRDTVMRRGLNADLLPLTHNYSIIKELTIRLHKSKNNPRPLSVRAAFAMIRDYEIKTGSQLYLSQRFMDAVVKGLTSERGAHFNKVLDSIRELLPEYFEYNGYVTYFLAHLVRHISNFIELRKLMPSGCLQANFYESLVSAMSKCTEANRREIAEAVLQELEFSLKEGIRPKSSYIIAILHNTGRFALQECLGFLKKHGIEVYGSGYDLHRLMCMVRTRSDYELVLTLAKEDISLEAKANILNGIAFAMYDMSSRRVRPEVLDEFNTQAIVREWHNLAAHDSKGSLFDAIKNIYQKVEDPSTEEAEEFFDFWEDVGGFRL